MRKNILIVIFSFFILLVITFVFPYKSFATETGNMSVYPSIFDPNIPNTRAWYQLKLNPADVYSSEVTIVNKSDLIRVFNTYPVDATTTSDGIFTLSPKGTTNDLGGWITLSSNIVTLAPKQKINIPFKISVPLNAQPGDHVAGIVVEEGLNHKQEGVNIVSRIGVRVYLNVSGIEKEKLNILKLSFDNFLYSKNINLLLSNDGNVNEEIKTNYTTLGLNGFKKFQIDSGRVLFAGKKITTSDQINTILPFFAKAEVTFGKSTPLTQSSIIVSPGILIISFLIISIGFYFIITSRKKRFKY